MVIPFLQYVLLSLLLRVTLDVFREELLVDEGLALEE